MWQGHLIEPGIRGNRTQVICGPQKGPRRGFRLPVDASFQHCKRAVRRYYQSDESSKSYILTTLLITGQIMCKIDKAVLRTTVSAMLFGGLFATNLYAQDAPPPAVVTHQIEVEPIDAPESFTASVEAIESVEIMARIQGFIDEVVFTPGQIVQTGDRLFQIEPNQYQAEVASAQANLA